MINVIMKKDYDYNDEIYYFYDSGTPIGATQNDELAEVLVKQKTVDFWLSNEPRKFCYVSNEIMKDGWEEILDVDNIYDLELTEKNVDKFIDVCLLSPFYFVKCEQF